MFEFSTFVLVLLGLAVVLVFLGVRTVRQGNEYTVERFGRYTHTLRPGLHLIVPVIDRIGAELDMMEQVLDVPSQEVITRDGFVKLTDCRLISTYFHEAKPLKLHRTTIGDLPRFRIESG